MSSGDSLRERLRGVSGAGGIERLDTAALRMTFPSRLRIRLRDGSTRVVEGAEPGSCGRPLAEQRAVVEERLEVAGVDVAGRLIRLGRGSAASPTRGAWPVGGPRPGDIFDARCQVPAPTSR